MVDRWLPTSDIDLPSKRSREGAWRRLDWGVSMHVPSFLGDMAEAGIWERTPMPHRKVSLTTLCSAKRLCVLTTFAFLTATTLHAQALWDITPQQLTTWADLEGNVANDYASITNEVQLLHKQFIMLPPGPFHVGFDMGPGNGCCRSSVWRTVWQMSKAKSGNSSATGAAIGVGIWPCASAGDTAV